MGAVAESVQAGGQTVIGVIPKALQPREISGTTVGELRIVPDMHTRKVRKQKRALNPFFSPTLVF